MKLFTEDLLRDTAALSACAFGVWVRIFLDLRNCGGSRSLSVTEWARISGTSREEIILALTELIEQAVCDASVTRDALSQIYDDRSNDLVTLTSRRIKREAKALKSHRIREQRYRDKRKRDAKNDAKRHASVTPLEIEAEAEAERRLGVLTSGEPPIGGSIGDCTTTEFSFLFRFKKDCERRGVNPEKEYERFVLECQELRIDPWEEFERRQRGK